MSSPENSLTLPRHLVIIPDGNGRWAQKHGLPIPEGHIRGGSTLINLASKLKDLDIQVVTFWGFSTENWLRALEEVQGLMGLTEQMILSEGEKLKEWGIRFRHIGRKDTLPPSLASQISRLEKETAVNSNMTFVLALDYGGRDEILRAVEKARASNLEIIDEQAFKGFLDTAGLPDPDLIIRTAGEARTSGMMPFQGVYAEFISSPVFFPDFDERELQRCLLEFSKRERRFGGRLRTIGESVFDWLDLKEETFEGYLDVLAPILDGVVATFSEQWRRSKFYNHQGLQEDIDIYQGLLTAGKKIRPALLMLAFENFGGESEFRQGALEAAIAYEVVHNSFLIHDDIEDSSILRRGKPSVHEQYRLKHQYDNVLLDPRQYGIALAINTGSLGPFKALDVIWGIDNRPERIVNAQKWIRYVIETTLLGQRLDLTNLSLDQLTERYVYQIYHQKTAVYTMVGPLILGAILAGISGKDLGYINTFGVNLGIAYQLIDDHLGLYGDEAVLGKPVDSDLKEAKKTLHFVRAYSLGDENVRAFLKRIWGNREATPEELEQVRRVVAQLGIRDFVLERVDTLAQRSRMLIPKITTNKMSATILEGLTHFVVARNY